MLRRKASQPRSVGIDNIDQYLFLGDSKITGGVALKTDKPGGWDAKYGETKSSHFILYRDDRTNDVSNAMLRNLVYNENQNRFPGYQAPLSSSPSVGIDNSFMWYMRQNSKKAVQLVKWSLGGTSLIARAGADNDWSPTTNEMYLSGFEYYTRYSANRCFQSGYKNAKFKAALVGLGTNDCVSGVYNSAAFVAAIPILVASIRSFVGQPALPIYWLQIRSDLYLSGLASYPQANVNEVRSHLLNCTSGGSTPISGFNIKDYESQTTTVDTVHEDTVSCEFMGIELATTFLALSE